MGYLPDFLVVSNGWKFFVVLIIPILSIWIPFVIPGTGAWADYNYASARYVFVITMLALLWIIVAIPLPVAGYICLVLFPLLRLQHAKTAGENVMKEQVMLLFGQLILGVALVFSTIHKRLALMILRCSGNFHAKIVSWLFFLTLGLSAVISSPTTAFLMLSVAQSLITEREEIDMEWDQDQDPPEEDDNENAIDNESGLNNDAPSATENPEAEVASTDAVASPQEEPTEAETLENRESKRSFAVKRPTVIPLDEDWETSFKNKLLKRYLIVIYVAANIGGLLLPHSSPVINLMYDFYDDRDRVYSIVPKPDSKIPKHFEHWSILIWFQDDYKMLTIGHWLLFSVPIIIILGLFAFAYLLFIFVKLSPLAIDKCSLLPCQKEESERERTISEEEKQCYRDKLEVHGKMSIQEILSTCILGALVILWITRDPKVFPGWSRSKIYSSEKPQIKVGDSAATFFIILAMFIIPQFKRKPTDQKPPALLGWKFLEGHVCWDVILMFGLQFVASFGAFVGKKNSLATHLYHLLNYFRVRGYFWTLMFFCLVLALLGSELFGGGATCNILLYSLGRVTNAKILLDPIGNKTLPTHELITNSAGKYGLGIAAMSSTCFMFPVASPTNALIFLTGSTLGCLGQLDMIKYGFVLDLFSFFVISAIESLYTQYSPGPFSTALRLNRVYLNKTLLDSFITR